MSEQSAPSKRTRAGLAVSTALSAFLFAWAALVLPWRPANSLALLAGVLSALHAVTALTAILLPRRLLTVWRVLALCSLGAAALFSAAIAVTSVEVVRSYGALGWGLTALLGVIGWLLLVCTVPVGIWGLRRTGRADDGH